MKYYIVENNQPVGPFEVDELVAKGVKATDLVWCEGMSQWTPASEVAEVIAQINATDGAVPPAASCQPPVFVQPQAPESPESQYATQVKPEQMPMPNTWLVFSILVTLFCCVPLGLVAVVKAAKVETLWRNGQYEEAKWASDGARKWALITFFIGIAFYVPYTIYLYNTVSDLL